MSSLEKKGILIIRIFEKPCCLNL